MIKDMKDMPIILLLSKYIEHVQLWEEMRFQYNGDKRYVGLQVLGTSSLELFWIQHINTISNDTSLDRKNSMKNIELNKKKIRYGLSCFNLKNYTFVKKSVDRKNNHLGKNEKMKNNKLIIEVY